ncbi:acetyl-CoA synthetase [Rhizobium giardinii]|uniref:Acetyl-CoA synthetase n=1 Tax=Rhizobium giardinii TaxID=56731 RepID=A0A7W8UGB6_9HYPH|nr:acetyl-CoA synthetase [Rhizobium giardinii]
MKNHADKVYPVARSARENGSIDKGKYEKWYEESVADPEKFWGEHGKRIEWFEPYSKVKNTSFEGDVSIKWFEDGLTNVS